MCQGIPLRKLLQIKYKNTVTVNVMNALAQHTPSSAPSTTTYSTSLLDSPRVSSYRHFLIPVILNILPKLLPRSPKPSFVSSVILRLRRFAPWTPIIFCHLSGSTQPAETGVSAVCPVVMTASSSSCKRLISISRHLTWSTTYILTCLFTLLCCY